MEKKKSGWLSGIITALICLALLAGVGFLLYPTVMNIWNEHLNRSRIEKYIRTVSEVSGISEDSELWKKAEEYNKSRTENEIIDAFTGKFAEEGKVYNELLNPNGTGVMGFIDIPKINVKLAIHHGVSPEVLQEGVGHLPGTSLPVGGSSTHTVLTGHRGLPSAKLFTDLDQLRPGDQFHLHIMGTVLAYEVEDVLVVEPHETDALAIQSNKDLATLVTCTPYGVNSHRLLIRGHRVEYQESQSGAPVFEGIDPLYILIAIAAGVLMVMGIIIAIVIKKRRAMYYYYDDDDEDEAYDN